MKKDILKDKNVIIMGAGKSGISAEKLLSKAGAKTIIYDENKELDKEALLIKLTPDTPRIYTGELKEEVIDNADLLVMSPGIPVDTKFVETFKEKKIPVWGEIELGYRYAAGRLVAITGTNGKTTTTALTGKIVSDYYKKSYIVGNIGDPYTDYALDINENDVTVAEVSSFQLETAVDFHPNVSAILNITPDHLNRHHTMECYVAWKESIAKNQTKDDTCVLNYEDEYLKDFGNRCNAKVVWFSSKNKLENGYYLDGEEIYFAKNGKSSLIIDVNDMKLLGIHNYENVMAAIAMTRALGIDMESIVKTVKEFTAVEHRIEYVATVDGVEYYNDSKGTNPDAAIKGIQAMKRKTVLIGGGYDKQNEYDEWIDSFDGKVSYLILIGQTKEKIAECARKHGFNDIILCDTFEEAFESAKNHANEGDAVLLSPACASWGMFKNYEERGRIFKEMVLNSNGK